MGSSPTGGTYALAKGVGYIPSWWNGRHKGLRSLDYNGVRVRVS